MTDPGTTTCRACGFDNHAGDQFCGSCGAFLEWEGEPSTSTEVSSDHSAAAAATDAAGPTATGAPAVESSVELIRCSACGIANPPTRTFCQSCGERLGKPVASAAATRSSTASPPRPTAAVPSAARPSGPATAPAAAQQRERPDTPSAGGIPRWFVVVVVLGLVVGIGGFAAVNLLLRDANVAPAAQVTASSALAANPARKAADGTTEHWNAAALAPQWIEFRLVRPTSIASITLEVAQDPAGRSIHEIWLQRTGGASQRMITFDGVTFDGDILEYVPPERIDRVETVRIVTTRLGDLFPAWREIEILGRPE